jgi:uncharacterized protein YlzI (FlbEa/FlbD family)
MTDTRTYHVLLEAIREVLTDEQQREYLTNAYFRQSIEQLPYTFLLLIEGSEQKAKREAAAIDKRIEAETKGRVAHDRTDVKRLREAADHTGWHPEWIREAADTIESLRAWVEEIANAAGFGRIEDVAGHMTEKLGPGNHVERLTARRVKAIVADLSNPDAALKREYERANKAESEVESLRSQLAEKEEVIERVSDWVAKELGNKAPDGHKEPRMWGYVHALEAVAALLNQGPKS